MRWKTHTVQLSTFEPSDDCFWKHAYTIAISATSKVEVEISIFVFSIANLNFIVGIETKMSKHASCVQDVLNQWQERNTYNLQRIVQQSCASHDVEHSKVAESYIRFKQKTSAEH